jgi:hypothetical protein
MTDKLLLALAAAFLGLVILITAISHQSAIGKSDRLTIIPKTYTAPAETACNVG